MALYQLLPVGVLKTDTLQRIIPQSGQLWEAYRAWVRAGNLPDPYVPPTPPAETLAQAKRRKAYRIKADGLERMQTRFESLQTFDTVQLLRETMLSVAPAARQLTANFQWLSDTYQAGQDALALVRAATTIAQVDSVTPAWPAL